LGDAEVRPQELGEKGEGHRGAVGGSTYVADPDALREAAFDELEAEPALPDPGVSRDADNPCAVGAASLQELIEQRLLRLAPDKCQRLLVSESPARRWMRAAAELEHRYLSREAAHRAEPECRGLDPRPGKPAGLLGEQDSVRRSDLLHP